MKTPRGVFGSRSTLTIVLVLWGLVLFCPTIGFTANGDCSQPVSNGAAPVATDCLFILNASVGLQTCSPECVCAPTGTLPAKATDALLCLNASVGAPVNLDCPCAPLITEGDDFNDNDRDNQRWGEASPYGNGHLNETGQHLEYTCGSGTVDDGEDWEWIATALPLNQNWEVQIDLVNLTVPSNADQVNSFGFGVYNPNDTGDDLYAELYASSLGGPPARNGFYAELYDTDAYIGSADSMAIETTTGAVHMLFDSSSKVIYTQYDANPGNGYQWITYGTFGIGGFGGANGNANWALGNSDLLYVYVYGYSAEMKVAAGKMTGDNFLVTTGVPFP